MAMQSIPCGTSGQQSENKREVAVHPLSTLTERGYPPDFDRALWLDPLTFQGLVGAGLASGIYRELFRPSGFAKSIPELSEDRRITKLIARL